MRKLATLALLIVACVWLTRGQSNVSAPAPSLPVASTSTTAANSFKFQNASGAAVNIKASAGNLYGICLTNETAAVEYAEFFNTASAPTLGTTAVVLAIKIPASATVCPGPSLPAWGNFSTGIGFATTTTENGTTAASVTGGVFFQ